MKKLGLPESTSQFVLALRPKDAPESVVYFLSSLYFSEKAVSDVRELIAATQPKAVVALVDLESISSFREEEKFASESFQVPTSIFGVIKENIERDPKVVPYNSRARIELSKSIFGVGAYGHILEAKESAAKVNATFRYVDFPYRSSPDHYDPAEPSPESSEHDGDPPSHAVNPSRVTHGLRNFAAETPLHELHSWRESCSAALAQMLDQNRSSSAAPPAATSTDASEVPAEKEEERVPPFAVPFVGLFRALSGLFKTQQLGEAHARAAKLFHDVEKGHEVDPHDLLEVCRYRVAVEMGRVWMNNMIRKPASTIPTRTAAEFQNLSYQEQCNALLAQSLQKEAREHGTVVAVIDVNRIPGIRKQWNQQLPEDVIPLIDECYISVDEVEEVNFLETLLPESMKHKKPESSHEKKAAVVVGAGAAAAVGLAYLPNWAAPLVPLLKFGSAKAGTLLKIGFLNSKRAVALSVAKGVPAAASKASAAKSASALKAAVTAEKAQAAAQGLVSGIQRQALQAIRTSFYSAMRGTQNKQMRRSAWYIFGGSVVAGVGMLAYGDKVERTLGSVSYAPDVAALGRGIQSVSEAESRMKLDWEPIYRQVYNPPEQGYLAKLKKKLGY